MKPQRVAMIGLGDMGAPMARRLVAAGYEVAGHDVDRARIEAAGAVPCDSAAAAVAGSSAAVVIVRTLDQVREVLFGAGGIAEAGGEGLDVALMSTIDPTSMAAFAKEANFRLVDAPVSGGVKGAEAGSLTIMVAGTAVVVERLRPLFEVFGANIFVVGDRPGMAQAVKLANQLMLAAAVLGTLEGLSVGRASGLEPEQVLPVIEASTGSSWAVSNFDVVRGFWDSVEPLKGALGIILKDLASIDREARARDLDLPAARFALEHLEDAWQRSGLEVGAGSRLRPGGA